jgi:hypothetical protein
MGQHLPVIRRPGIFRRQRPNGGPLSRRQLAVGRRGTQSARASAMNMREAPWSAVAPATALFLSTGRRQLRCRTPRRFAHLHAQQGLAERNLCDSRQ